RCRIPAGDAQVPRVESGTPLALLARDRLSGLLHRRARADLRALRRRRGIHARRRNGRRGTRDLRERRARRVIRQRALCAHAVGAIAEHAGATSRGTGCRDARPRGAAAARAGRRRSGRARARRGARAGARRLVQSAPVSTPRPVNVWEYEQLAAERLEPGAHGYYAGGAGDELTLRWNVEAYRRWQLRPRVLVDVATCTTATTVLGQELSLPLIVAPVAFQRVAHPDGEVGMARAANAVGTAMCLSTMSTSTFEQVAETGVPRWFQLYVFRDRGVTRELVRRAADAGFTALALTVDTPVLGRRERDFRTGFTIPPDIEVASLGQGGVTPLEAFGWVSEDVSWRDVEA